MKLVTFSRIGEVGAGRPGVLVDRLLVDLRSAAERLPQLADGLALSDMRALIGGGDAALASAAALAEEALRKGVGLISTSECRLHAPIEPRQIACVGLNFAGPAQQVQFRQGEGAPLFLKAVSTITGPDADIVIPAQDVGPVSAELELGVVIGKAGRHIPVEEALSHIAGYTVLLDVTAQHMMDRDAYAFAPPGSPESTHIVMFRAKNYDSFTPIGPAIVSRDEIGEDELGGLAMSAAIDGELYVDATMEGQLLKVAEAVSYVSSITSLAPGDLIATGHPGYLRPTPLTPGSTLTARIEKVGELTVGIVKETLT